MQLLGGHNLEIYVRYLPSSAILQLVMTYDAETRTLTVGLVHRIKFATY